MSIEMHSTVPDCVRSIISTPEALNRGTAGCPEIGIRLVSTSYPDMHSVWARVRQHKDAEFPCVFFWLAAGLPARWRSTPKTPTKALQHTVSEIAAAAEELAALVETHEKEIAFSGGGVAFHRVMVRARTIRAELVGEAERPDPMSYVCAELARPPQPTLPDFLLALAAELRPLRPPAQLAIRPTKVADKNAERTFMVRSLSDFLNTTLGDPSFDVVAVTVNTVLDAKDDLLDANHARKLAVDLL